MRISQLTVKNFRCLHDVSMPIEKYTVCIGANGAGKSTVLYALAWFFDQFPCLGAPTHFDHGTEEVSVEVTFSDITPHHRGLLGRFGRNEETIFRRTYDPTEPKAKYFGTAWMGPGFADVYSMTNANDYRPAYNALRQEVRGLPQLEGNFLIAEIRDELRKWEGKSENKSALVRVENQPADELFAEGGGFPSAVRLVIVKGSTELAQQIDGDTKDLPFTSLTATLVSDATVKTKTDWAEKYKRPLLELKTDTSRAVQLAIDKHKIKINSALNEYIGNASIEFRVPEPIVNVSNLANVGTEIQIGNSGFHEVTLEGHGNQRTLMMSMVESLAEADEGDESKRPLKVIAIEEPEIFQHPVRARAMGRKLSRLSERESAQVVIATHSPYFVRPEQFGSLRRIHSNIGKSSATYANPSLIAQQMGLHVNGLLKHMQKEIPKTITEGFFSNCVLVVEGDSDSAVLEPIAEHLGIPLEPQGISIWAMDSKSSPKMHYSILSSLGTKVYALVDGDFKPNDNPQQSRSHQNQTNDALAVVSPMDQNGTAIPYVFGDPTLVAHNMSIFQDDLEHELRSWPSFMTLCPNLGNKDVYGYRQAAVGAQAQDIPTT